MMVGNVFNLGFSVNSMDITNLDDAIDRFRILAVKSRYEEISEEDFIGGYLSDLGLRPYFEILFNALGEMERYSLKDLEEIGRNGVIFRQSPRYDFYCHEESAREALYSFATGKNKFVCSLKESLENIVNLLENYKLILRFNQKM